jgi:hypothetical protein
MVLYSSLKEVYGDDFTKKYEERNIKQEDLTKVAFDKDPTPLYLRNKGYNQEQCYNVKSYNSGSPNVEYNMNYKNEEKYQKLREKSENERMDQIQNMNLIERPMSKEELIQKYNHNDLTKRSILMERLNLLKNEMDKQNNNKIDFTKTNNNLINSNYLNNLNNQHQKKNQNIQENFENSLNTNNFLPINQNNQQNINQEFLDLFFLIIMGLILLYVFEYIFKMGKIIGARCK